jgi:protein phosphatase
LSTEIEEPTAEFTVEQLSQAVQLRVKPVFTFAAKTDLGRVRENNEDKFDFYLPGETSLLASRGSIFLVCDGMGGHAAGQIASELASKTFIDVYMHHPSNDAHPALTSAVVAANRFVLDNCRTFPDRRGMGTTLSALIFHQDALWTVQVGDSRIYRLRGGELAQLTTDHTWVEEALKEGVITESEAVDHPYKHVLTRAIGAEQEVRPDISLTDMLVGDTFLICSDGLINHVSDEAIHEVLSQHGPTEAAWKLVALALQGGGSDNTTVVIIRLDAFLFPEGA